MFDSNVETEGLGRADAVMDAERLDRMRATGVSPDGLGAYVNPEPGDPYQSPGPQMPQAPPAPMYTPQYSSQMAGPIEFIEPEDTSSGSALRSSGFTLLFVALSTGVGYAWRGGQGAVSGLLLSAGLANGYRAQKWFGSDDPSEKHESMVSTIFAAGELFGGAYLAYQAAKSGRKE